MKEINRKFVLDRTRLSLDASTQDLGYSVYKGEEKLVSGMIKCSGSTSEARIESARQIVLALIKKYTVKEVILEDIQLQYTIINGKRCPMLKSYKTLCELRGVLINTAITNDCYVYSYPASEWRKVFKIKQGRGILRAESKESGAKILQSLGVDFKSIDECEAILLMLAFIKTNKE